MERSSDNEVVKKIFSFIKNLNYYRVVNFTLSLLTSYSAFSLLVSKVSFSKFFVFWFTLDLVFGFVEYLTTKLVIRKEEINDKTIDNTYLLVLLAASVLMATLTGIILW